MTLLNVMEQVFDTHGDTFTLGVNRFFLGIGIKSQEVTRRSRSHTLLNCKTNPVAGFRVRVHRIRQTQHSSRVK